MSGNLLIFDLDGTLIDSKRDLTDSVNATRESRGLPALPDDIVSAYVGNGAPMLIRRALPHLNDEEHAEGIRCLAAPVFSYSGQVVASLCTIAPKAQIHWPEPGNQYCM